MGYRVHIESGTIKIPEEHLGRVYKALCELNHLPDDVKNGGSWQGGQQHSAWFSWMDANYDETCVNAQEVLAQVGFLDMFVHDGHLVLSAYDSKQGQERLFIAAIAPWITPDSALYWVGEDGDRWRWTFRGGILEEHSGRVVYDDNPAIHL